MKTKAIAYIMFFLMIFNCQKNISGNMVVKNPTTKTDTVKVTYYPNNILKEVDLKKFEGDKNVRLNFSETGILLHKTVNYDSYPTINFEYNENRNVIHQYEQGNIGGCIAIKGEEYFWDDSGLLFRKIIHSDFGKTCSEKVLIQEITDYYDDGKSLKSIGFTRESYEGSEECPCGIRKEFNIDGRLKKEKKFKDCKSESSECDQELSDNLISLNSKWYGKYFFTLTSKDNLDGTNYKIDLNITKDSIIYSAEGYQIDHKFFLSGKEKNDKLYLNYLDSKDGSYSQVLEETKDFGVISRKNTNFIWESPYLNAALSDTNTKHLLNKK